MLIKFIKYVIFNVVIAFSFVIFLSMVIYSIYRLTEYIERTFGPEYGLFFCWFSSIISLVFILSALDFISVKMIVKKGLISEANFSSMN